MVKRDQWINSLEFFELLVYFPTPDGLVEDQRNKVLLICAYKVVELAAHARCIKQLMPWCQTDISNIFVISVSLRSLFSCKGPKVQRSILIKNGCTRPSTVFIPLNRLQWGGIFFKSLQWSTVCHVSILTVKKNGCPSQDYQYYCCSSEWAVWALSPYTLELGHWAEFITTLHNSSHNTFI